MKVSPTSINPNFSAKPISMWRCSSRLDNSVRNISIIELEKRDYDFADKFVKSLGNYKGIDPIKTEILTDAARTLEKVLECGNRYLQKIKLFMAAYNSSPCGLLIANIPKEDEYGKIVYSSRHNCAKNETELDWLVTWSPEDAEPIKGIGKAILGEYFGTVHRDKFRDVYVRSELPENTYAQYFYESMGFEPMGDKRHLLGTKTTNKSLINEPEPENDRIIPMIVTRKKIREVYNNVSQVMSRQEFIKKSYNIRNLLKI